MKNIVVSLRSVASAHLIRFYGIKDEEATR